MLLTDNKDSVFCIECCCVCHQRQICKKEKKEKKKKKKKKKKKNALCLNLYPCVIII